MKSSKTMGVITVIMVVAWIVPATACFTLAWGFRWCWQAAKQGWAADGFWDGRV